MSELSSSVSSVSLSLSPSHSWDRLGFLIFTHPVPSSLALPGANSLLEDRAPIPSPLLPSSTALGARSIHGIASWFSEGSRLSPTTPDGAPLALSRCVFAYWLTHGATSDPPHSFSLSLSLSLLAILFSSLLLSLLLPPLFHTLCLAARLRSQPATRARQLRNNNNAVRRCVASCGA